MHVTKLRGSAENGLMPAGHYFARVAGALRDANERSAGEDARLETRYRRARATRMGRSGDEHPMM